MWARLDDQFYQNAKQLSMSDAAFRLYVCSLSFAADDKAQTGFLGASRAHALARSLRKGKKQIRELEELRAWEPCEGGWVIHDFDQYVDRGAAERTRKWRRDHCVTEASPGSHGDVTVTSSGSHGDVSRGSASAGGNPGPVPVPGALAPKAPLAPVPREQRLSSQAHPEDPLVVAVAGRYEELAGHPPSAIDLDWLRRVPYECPRLSEEQALAALDQVAAKHAARGKPMPHLKYLAGRFADLDHAAADAGAVRSRERRGGMSSVGDVLGGAW